MSSSCWNTRRARLACQQDRRAGIWRGLESG